MGKLEILQKLVQKGVASSEDDAARLVEKKIAQGAPSIEDAAAQLEQETAPTLKQKFRAKGDTVTPVTAAPAPLASLQKKFDVEVKPVDSSFGKKAAALGFGGAGLYAATREKPTEQKKPEAAPASVPASPAAATKETPPTPADKKKPDYSSIDIEKQFAPVYAELKKLQESGDERQKAAAEKYLGQMQGLEAQMDQALAYKKQARTEQAWARVMENLFKNIVRFSAASQGLRQGVDLSNIQMAGWDWKADSDALEADTQDQLDVLRAKYARAEKAGERETEGIRREVEKQQRTTETIGTTKAKMKLDQTQGLNVLQQRENVPDKEAAREKIVEAKSEKEKQQALTKAESLYRQAGLAKSDKERKVYLEDAAKSLEKSGVSLGELIPEARKDPSWFQKLTGGDPGIDYSRVADALLRRKQSQGGLIRMQAPDGRELQVPEDQVSRLEKLGAKRK